MQRKNMYNILIVSEDPALFSKLDQLKQKHHCQYIFHLRSEKSDIANFILNNPTSLIILSNLNIITLLKINSTLAKIPIIFWAPCGNFSSEIKALSGGADSYFNQLSSWILLLSKLNSLLRKIVIHDQEQQDCMHKYIFLSDTLEVEFHGHCQKLSTKEYIILETLSTNPTKTYSQYELNDLTSGEDVTVSSRSVDTFVSVLRHKIGYDSIISVRNKGYKINENFLYLPVIV